MTNRFTPAKDIVFLDMDGTITPPREHIESSMLLALMDLCYSTDVAIVSGSDIDYMMEQCGEHFLRAGMFNRVVLMPCNGTKVYHGSKNGYNQTYSRSVKDELGDRIYRRIISGFLEAQSKIMYEYDIPVSGRFISYRGSMFNWSLIGREYSLDDRISFASRSDRDDIRRHAMKLFRIYSRLPPEELDLIDLVLAGETSIDIYPKGWDKRYALKHIGDQIPWFIGDRCKPGQNDFEIFTELSQHGRGYMTSGPEDTIKIIDEIIDQVKGF